MPITKGQGNPDWTRDETILAMDLLIRRRPQVPGEVDPDVMELSRLLRVAPIHPLEKRNEKFRNPSGVSMKLQNLDSVEAGARGRRGLSRSSTDRAVWEEFKDRPEALRTMAAAIRRGLAELPSPAETLVDDDEELPEGRVLTAKHKVRERQKGFRRKVLKRNRKAFGRTTCEACNRPGRVRHAGERVEQAEFEVHHVVPLAVSEERKTRVSDLALLCAGCHRLIHAASRARGHLLDLDEFRDFLAQT